MMTKEMERVNAMAEELMPTSGKADSLAGELLRAVSRIGYRFYNDGDQVGIGYGNETCNAAARFLGAHGTKKVACLARGMWGMEDEELYEAALDLLCKAVADQIDADPSLRTTPTEDMWSYYRKEDENYDENDDEYYEDDDEYYGDDE